MLTYLVSGLPCIDPTSSQTEDSYLVKRIVASRLPIELRTLGSRADAGGTVGKRVEALWEDDLNFYPATVVKDCGGESLSSTGRVCRVVSCSQDFENGTVQIRWDDPDGHPDISNSDLEDVRPLRLSYSPGVTPDPLHTDHTVVR